MILTIIFKINKKINFLKDREINSLKKQKITSSRPLTWYK